MAKTDSMQASPPLPTDGPFFLSILTVNESLEFAAPFDPYPTDYTGYDYFFIEKTGDWSRQATWTSDLMPFLVEPNDHVLLVQYSLQSPVHDVKTQHVAVGPTGGSAFARIGSTDVQVRINNPVAAELWTGANNEGTFFHSMYVLDDHSIPARLNWSREVRLPLHDAHGFSTYDVQATVSTSIEGQFFGIVEIGMSPKVIASLSDPEEIEAIHDAIQLPLLDREREGQYSPTCNWRIQDVGHPCHSPWFW